jgi:hypothetical protein
MYPDLLTVKFLNYLAYDALTSNLTLIMGDKVPNIELSKLVRWFYRFYSLIFYHLLDCIKMLKFYM